jgi:hypothetical protein
MVAILAMGMATPARADLEIWISEALNPPGGASPNPVASGANSASYTNSTTFPQLTFTSLSGTSNVGSGNAGYLSTSGTIANTGTSSQNVFILIGNFNYTTAAGASVPTSVSVTVNATGTGSSNSFKFNSYVVKESSPNSTAPSNTTTSSQSVSITALGTQPTNSDSITNTQSTPYQLTERFQITLNPGASITFNASTGTAVPEPSSMAIAGLGALGMIGYGLRRRKASGV